MYPENYRYSKDHEWLAVEGDIGTLGITHFAQDELGEVVFVELPDVGQSFAAHDEIGTIESVKAVAEVFSPISGEIVEINESLADAPEVLNEDPHGAGWLVKIKITSQDEVGELMDSAAYQQFSEGDD